MLIGSLERGFEDVNDAIFGGDLDEGLDRFEKERKSGDTLTPIPDSNTAWSLEMALTFTSTSKEKSVKRDVSRE
jgi:hypothetical protein